MNLTLLDDRPLEDLRDEDGRGEAARLLRDAAASVRAPACIAVYGPWGSGKTSLLGALRSLWNDGATRGPVVWFDPWMYERRGDALTALLVEVARTLKGAEKSKWEKAKGLFEKALSVTLALGVRVGSAALFGGAIPELAHLDGMKGLGVKDFDGLLERADAWFDEVKKVREQFHDAIEACVPEGQKLLVLLDDLDRCQPEHALALIEGVKLLLCGDRGGAGRPGTRAVFAFALDRQVVGEAIRQRYPNSSLYTGESYLEKIFDLSVEVPGLRTLDRTRTLAGWLAELGNVAEMEAAFGELEHTVIAVLKEEPFNNPRVAKRALNRLSILVHARGEIVKRLGGDYPPHPDRDRKEPLKRLVAWVAAAERYRTFRSYVRTASKTDLGALMAAVSSANTPNAGSAPVLSPDAAALLATPGFALLMSTHLKPKDGTGDELRPRSGGSGAPAGAQVEGALLRVEDPRWANPPIFLIDELLREVGL